MRFSEQQLNKTAAGLSSARKELALAFWRILDREYRTERGQEFAHHGVARRVKMMARTLDRTFEIIPPERSHPLSEDEAIDVEKNIHSSIMATAGIVDNLAWLWVTERKLQKKNGKEFLRSEIGFRSKQSEIRASLPTKIMEKIDSWEGWMRDMEDYRDALAHRIPPYVARFSVDDQYSEEFQDLMKERAIARTRHDRKALQRIETRLNEIQFFSPFLQHSFGEKARPVLIHGMMIVNSRSAAELTLDFIDALDKAPPAV